MRNDDVDDVQEWMRVWVCEWGGRRRELSVARATGQCAMRICCYFRCKLNTQTHIMRRGAQSIIDISP